MIFRNWVMQNFPFLEDDFDALTDYELFCKMIEYVKELVKDNKQFEKQIKDLENYVYNLDLQEEVNNKLDEMAESGELENIIGQYVELKTTYVYNNVAEMKASTNLVNGSYARTSGYYTFKDGGGAFYKVRQMTNDDVADDCFLIALNNPLLVAELVYNNEINYLQAGGVINDEDVDSTTLVQKLIDALSVKKCGKIYFPQGSIYFKGSLTLKSNVELIGFGDYSTWNLNEETGQDKATTFYHVANEESNFITSNYTDTSQLNYQPNINLKNLYIVGNSNTKNGLYLAGISKSVIENIMIINCQNNIHIEYAMTTDFIRVFSQRASEYCLLIDNSQGLELSTTINFYNCYFGQTRESGGSPMKIDYRSLVGGNFVDCTFETSDESIEIDTYNEIYFTNIYCENIPDTGTNSMFKIGTTTSLVAGEKGIITINGGTIYGPHAWYESGNESTIFDIDNLNNLTVTGCVLRRADYTVKTTTNTDRVTFIGTTEGQIAHGINTYKSNNKILYLNCNNTSYPIDDKTFIPVGTPTLNTLTLQNNWTDYAGLKYATFGNIVSIYFSCQSGTANNGTVISTIPSGYRPASFTKIPIMCATDDAILTGDNFIYIDSDTGNIKIFGTGFSSGKVYIGNVTYMIK